MSRLMAVFVTSALTAWFPLSYQAPITELNSGFESADVVSATDIPYPVRSIAIGTVVFEVTVSETGTVEDVRATREIQSLTDVAIESVKNWHFKPASLNGRAVRSRTAVAVTFNPAATPAASVPLPPLSSNRRSSGPAQLQPQPLEVIAAMFAQYPVNSVSMGTVVLRVSVDKVGNVVSTTAVRRIPSLTSQCIRAVKEWRFKPAKFEGTPSPSSVALAFVLRPPVSTN